MKSKNIRAVLVVVLLLLIFTVSIASAEEKTVVTEIEKGSLKAYFNKNAYNKKEKDKYINHVWQQWVTKELKEADIQSFSISREKITLIVVDLNGDGYKDFIATVIANDYYCGKFGADCEFRLFVAKTQGGFRQITSCMSIFHARPVYILNNKVNGLKKIIVNDKFTLEFNGKEYCNNN
jgi:hypothetical protein